MIILIDSTLQFALVCKTFNNQSVNIMLKKYPILKWSLITVTSLIILIFAFGFWFISLIAYKDTTKELKSTFTKDIPYLSQSPQTPRGKILAVVTSCQVMGKSNKPTGYELTELARAYYVFLANGFEVDIASPLGGTPAVIIDQDDMGAFDYAFLNDTLAQYKATHTIPIATVNPENYEAVFFAGGKGAMFDFPQNSAIQSLIRQHYQTGKVIGAVCHGPAALVNVKLDDGQALLANKTVSSFTNNEELFLIPKAKEIFPFLLQDKLVEQGAKFNSGHLYLEKVSQDGNLVTGQNPWSTWALAETMIQQMGYTPKKREITTEENTISALSIYETKGYNEAKTKIEDLILHQQKPVDRTLLAMHSIVAAMDWNIGKAFELIKLLSYIKSISQ